MKPFETFAPSKTTIRRWFIEFKCGHTSTNDVPCSGRPIEALNKENAKKIYSIILEDRRGKVREIADTIKMLKASVKNIYQERFHMKRLCALSVPQSLKKIFKKNSNMSMILSAILRYFSVTQMRFCADSQHCMKYGYITTYPSDIDSRLSACNRSKADQRCNNQLQRPYPVFLGCT